MMSGGMILTSNQQHLLSAYQRNPSTILVKPLIQERVVVHRTLKEVRTLDFRCRTIIANVLRQESFAMIYEIPFNEGMMASPFMGVALHGLPSMLVEQMNVEFVLLNKMFDWKSEWRHLSVDARNTVIEAATGLRNFPKIFRPDNYNILNDECVELALDWTEGVDCGSDWRRIKNLVYGCVYVGVCVHADPSLAVHFRHAS